MESVVNYDTSEIRRRGENSNTPERKRRAFSLTDNRNRLVKVGLEKTKQIDLRNVSMKLARAEDGRSISPDELRLSVILYKEFLALLYAYQDKTIVPTKQIDTVWHQHILDTRAYAADSESMFGFFLHHYPYFGLNGPEDAQRLMLKFDETCAIWVRHFGHSPAVKGSHMKHSACSRACSSCSAPCQPH